MLKSRRRILGTPVGRLVVVVVLANFVVFILVGISLGSSHALYREQASALSRNVSRLVAQSIASDIERIDLGLRTVVDEYARLRSSGDPIEQRHMTDFLARQQERLPMLDGLRIADMHGTVVFGSDKTLPQNISTADRDYFLAQRANADRGLFISSPVLGRISGKWVLIFSRRLSRPDGGFDGIVFAPVTLGWFEQTFSKLEVGANGTVVMRGDASREFDLLARVPSAGFVGQTTVSQQFRTLITHNPWGGTYEANAGADNISRIYSYRPIDNYPLITLVGLATKDTYAEWWRDVIKLGALAAVFTLMTIFGTRAVLRAWRTRTEALGQFHLLLTSAGAGIFGIDNDGICTFCNPAATKLLGYKQEGDLLGQDILQRICPAAGKDSSPPHDECQMFDVLRATDEIHVDGENFLRADGTSFPVEYWSRRQYHRGQPSGAVVTFADISERRRAEAALRESEARFRKMFEHHDAVMLLIEPKSGAIVDANAAASRFYGHLVDHLQTMSIDEINALSPAEVAAERTRALREDRNYFTFPHRLASGEMRMVEVHSSPIDFADRTLLFSIIHDISDRLAAEEALRKSEAKFAAIFEMTPEPMALTRIRDGAVIEASRSFAELFGYQPAEIDGRSTLPSDLGLWLEAQHRRLWQEQMERYGQLGGFETPMRRKDGSIVTVLISGKVVELGGERCAIVDFHDITDQKQHAEHLEHLAHHDLLTGLPNRLLLGDRLRQAIAQNQRAGTSVAVCYLDLDGFKEVNDLHGHRAGDRLLREVASRLKLIVRGGDTVARLGGDEFVLLLCGLTSDDEWRAAIERVVQAISAPYQIQDSEAVCISASIGVTIFPEDQVDSDTLVRHADHAMYAAKQSGKNRYQLFDSPFEQRIEATHATRKRIEAALSADQFVLHYQPKVDCRNGRIEGVEALIRWQHPTLGLLQPAAFLPMIEDDRLAVVVGHWVIREALRQIAVWQAEGIDLRVSVNAFARQLIEPDFTRQLETILGDYPGTNPNKLAIEIVETAALKGLDNVRAAIEDCRALGVPFALDDFGTGYSSLVYLRHLPAQEIKIDQSFVRNMLTNSEDQAIVEAVIGLGKAFHRSVVAEGAETQAHILRLLELGCDVMQGYALARPMPGSDIGSWMRDFRPDPAWLASLVRTSDKDLPGRPHPKSHHD